MKMITVYYPSGLSDIAEWKERLNNAFLLVQMIEKAPDSTPLLVDGKKKAEGIPAIETYISELEQFVKGWYEDRCDRHDFDPDTQAEVSNQGI